MINIYLRHSYYSPNSAISNRQRPEWFDKIKVFNNLKSMLTSNCKLTVIYDTHFGDNHLDEMYKGIPMFRIDCGTEAKSFLLGLDIICHEDLADDEIIYFLEDDYLHREGWDKALIEGLAISDYVSLYDHLDKYLNYPDLTSKILITEKCHWRTVPSTCNSYACTVKTLYEDMAIHQLYSTQHNNGVSNDNEKFLHLSRNGKKLITPIPGFSTHCDAYQSPIINWENYIK